MKTEEIKVLELKNVFDAIEYIKSIKPWEISLETIPSFITSDKTFILEALKLNGNLLKDINKEFLLDKQLVLVAVTQSGKALKYAKEFNNDKEIVIAATSQDGQSLKYASENIKNDKEVILKILKKESNCLQYVSEELKKDKGLVLVALQMFGKNYNGNNPIQYVDNSLLCDVELMNETIKNDPFSIRHFGSQLKSNKEIMMPLLEENGEILLYASVELKDDKDVVLIAVEQDPESIRYATNRVKNNKEVALAALKKAEKIDASIKANCLLVVIDALGHKLRAEIGNNEPIAYLESILLKSKIENDMLEKENNQNKTRIKI